MRLVKILQFMNSQIVNCPFDGFYTSSTNSSLADKSIAIHYIAMKTMVIIYDNAPAFIIIFH